MGFGFPLLISGVVIFLFALSTFPQTGDWFGCLLGVGCMLIALTSFGVNHDTAVAYCLLLEKDPSGIVLNHTMRHEMEEDLSWDRAGTLALKANPKTAVVAPWLAIALQMYVVTRVCCKLGIDFRGNGVCSSFWFG